MCGIAGYIGNRTLNESTLKECLQKMGRRGPDHGDYREFHEPSGRNVYLLHTRLSIIDLDPRSNQPFKRGSKTIVFNGEIYNYTELKERLTREGVTFSTESDTEVLVTALDQYGVDALDRCEGMWALACYDEKDRTFLLSRDRFSEKPLYLFQDSTGLYFGSEVKLIESLLGRKLRVNMGHLSRYMVNGYKALYKSSETFFEGIFELPAASFIRLKPDGTEERHAYWEPHFAPRDTMTRDEAIHGVRERLIRAVQLRLRADVPLAFCMSGGVDSNSLISIAKKVFNYDVHGFTIVNTDSRYEEQDIIDNAVKDLKVRHTSIPLDTKGFLPKLRQLIRYHDAPVYTITYYAQWLLMESVAAHGYRISISGTAADELFSGYYDHHLAYLRQVSSDPRLHKTSLEAWTKHIKPLVRNPFLSDPDLFVKDSEFRDHIYLNAEEFASFLKKPWHEPFSETRYSDDLLRSRMMNELFAESVPVILHEDDLNSMYFSVENRSPFLDRDLFEFCNTIPTRYLMRDGFTKSLLRDAMRDIAPDAVLDSRRKVGFNAPIYSFLDVNDPNVRGFLLDDSPIFEHLRRDKVEELIQKASLPNSESKFLFYFLNSKIFLEEFGS